MIDQSKLSHLAGQILRLSIAERMELLKAISQTAAYRIAANPTEVYVQVNGQELRETAKAILFHVESPLPLADQWFPKSQIASRTSEELIVTKYIWEAKVSEFSLAKAEFSEDSTDEINRRLRDAAESSS